MSVADSSNPTFEELQEKIKLSLKLSSDCQNLPEIRGKQRLSKRVNAETGFLTKLVGSQNLKADHVHSSNLTHLTAIYKCVTLVTGVTKILEPFIYHQYAADQKRLVVDVVCDHGNTWIKVIARNPLALILTSSGAGKYGQKTIVEQVKDIIECAKQNEYMFKVPAIKVWFFCSFSKQLHEILQDLPVDVTFMLGDNKDSNSIEDVILLESSGECSVRNKESISDFDETLDHRSHVDCELAISSIPQESVLNLDVSTMIAYTSNLTNGYANVKVQDGILSEQAARELIYSVGTVLRQLFKGRQLICCHTAYIDFQTIVSCVAGPMEKERADELFKEVTVVSDKPSDRTMQLQASSKVKPRSKVVFGTGDSHQAVTVTANYGFLRAAQGQGVKFVAVFHESRAFSERKEVKD